MTQSFDLPDASDSLSDSRVPLNDALQTILTNSSGASAPGASYREAWMFWGDDTNDLLKMRNSDDDAWLTLWNQSEGPRYAVAIRLRTGQANNLLMCWPFDARLERAYLLSDTSTSGSDGSNNLKFDIKNPSSGVSFSSTVKGTDDEEVTANTRWLFTVDQNQDVDDGDPVSMATTINGSPTSLTTADLVVGLEFTRR